MGRTFGCIVSVGAEKAAIAAIVAGDNMSLNSRRLKLKSFLNFRRQPIVDAKHGSRSQIRIENRLIAVPIINIDN